MFIHLSTNRADRQAGAPRQTIDRLVFHGSTHARIVLLWWQPCVDCARPMRGVRDRALREHGDCPSYPKPLFRSPPTGGSNRLSRKAAVIYRALRGGWDDPHCAPLPNPPISFLRVAWSILDCARRTSTFLSCAFREQEDGQATLPILLRPRVAQARGSSQLPHPFFQQSPDRLLKQDYPARPQPKNRQQAYPQGYVEDLFEARTKLGVCFSSRY